MNSSIGVLTDRKRPYNKNFSKNKFKLVVNLDSTHHMTEEDEVHPPVSPIAQRKLFSREEVHRNALLLK